MEDTYLKAYLQSQKYLNVHNHLPTLFTVGVSLQTVIDAIRKLKTHSSDISAVEFFRKRFFNLRCIPTSTYFFVMFCNNLSIHFVIY